MRAHAALIPILFALSVAGAFAAGHYIGSYDTEKRFKAAADDISNQRSVETLFMVNTAIERLEDSRIEEAHQGLVRYAKLQVQGVVACSKSPMCALLAGKLLQSPAELQKVASRDERLSGTH